jgi:orotidine 5'-phosphate decarboxylase subfamily 1
MLTQDRLIVALDVPGASQARQIVQAIGDAATTYKIGKQLFTAEGPQVVRDLVSSGRKVFLDLKFHDIPNTVAGAVKSAAELGVSMLTVHASGGSKMLQAAVEAAAQSSAKPMILAVTVLTSLSESDLQEIGVSGNVLTQVLRLAALAKSAGCGGVVASAQEARNCAASWAKGSPSLPREFALRARRWETRYVWSHPKTRLPRARVTWWSAGRSWKLRTRRKLRGRSSAKSAVRCNWWAPERCCPVGHAHLTNCSPASDNPVTVGCYRPN